MLYNQQLEWFRRYLLSIGYVIMYNLNDSCYRLQLIHIFCFLSQIITFNLYYLINERLYFYIDALKTTVYRTKTNVPKLDDETAIFTGLDTN